MKINRCANIKVMEGISDMYQIYSDGRVYSSHNTGKIMKPYALYSRGNKKHRPKFTYNLQVAPNTPKSFYATRLVMFYFGKHNYKKMEDMPLVTNVDCDSANCNIGNLKFTTHTEVITKSAKTFPKGRNSKIKDTQVNIKNITKYTNDGWNLNQIGRLYNVSDMAIHRFKKRNKI